MISRWKMVESRASGFSTSPACRSLEMVGDHWFWDKTVTLSDDLNKNWMMLLNGVDWQGGGWWRARKKLSWRSRLIYPIPSSPKSNCRISANPYFPANIYENGRCWNAGVDLQILIFFGKWSINVASTFPARPPWNLQILILPNICSIWLPAFDQYETWMLSSGSRIWFHLLICKVTINLAGWSQTSKYTQMCSFYIYLYDWYPLMPCQLANTGIAHFDVKSVFVQCQCPQIEL